MDLDYTSEDVNTKFVAQTSDLRWIFLTLKKGVVGRALVAFIKELPRNLTWSSVPTTTFLMVYYWSTTAPTSS